MQLDQILYQKLHFMLHCRIQNLTKTLSHLQQSELNIIKDYVCFVQKKVSCRIALLANLAI